jgi:hypothetical protein
MMPYSQLLLKKKATFDRRYNWEATPTPEPAPTADVGAAVKVGVSVFVGTIAIFLPIAVLLTYCGLAIADRRAARPKVKKE